MALHQVNIDVDLEVTEISEWPADFDADVDRGDRQLGEPPVVVTDCKFFRAHIGSMEVTRDMLIQMAGLDAVEEIERRAGDEIERAA